MSTSFQCPHCPRNFSTRNAYSQHDYAGDISFGEISHSSNIPEEYENFDEILPASLQSNEEPVSHSSNIPEEYENFDEILPYEAIIL
ncbi:hypothetical protein Glove_150g3 [Diversispora epigaea]|uniref:C2H2-type domain-containing protein n=1 Tax=Diversispora epigaea TaxID=1348612 RepID=A0A397J2V6_9GLOM|nr:hypothetical protein Glove_150g3 [Diversispora epigaea]